MGAVVGVVEGANLFVSVAETRRAGTTGVAGICGYDHTTAFVVKK